MATPQKGARYKVLTVNTGGLKLRRESTTNPLPDDTTITLESVEDQSSNGRTSYKVTYTYNSIKNAETGWMESDPPSDGAPYAELFEIWYMVNEDDVRLRNEPNTNDKTKNNQKNIIEKLAAGTIVRQGSYEVVDSNGYKWFYIMNLQTFGEPGWIASKFLDEIIPYSEEYYRNWVNSPPLPPGTAQSPLSATASVKNVYYNKKQKFSVAYLQSEPADVTLGAVKYKKNGTDKTTSVEDWNDAVGTNKKYKIQV